MIPLWTTVASILLVALAELLHARRSGRVARLAFGPGGRPRKWTQIAPWVRVVAAGSIACGLTTLLLIGPRAARSDRVPQGGYRHLVLVLDVSPSMQLEDAGPAGKDSRARRAGEVLMSLLQRIATDQVRISVVAFYTDAKPVVVDTYDLDVVKNALSDLPLDLAFDVGKTDLLQGIRQAAELARPWQPESTTVVVASDGDTISDSGTPELPRSVHRTLIVGVGDSRSGRFIDGHQSRQDMSTLRQLARRLRGDYFDANERLLPSTLLAALAGSVPLRDTHEKGRREIALAAVGIGSFLLAFLPVALDLAGCAWQLSYRSRKTSSGARHGLSVPPLR